MKNITLIILTAVSICLFGCSFTDDNMICCLRCFAGQELSAVSRPSLYYGDVSGGKEPEIILISGKEIGIYNLDLELLRSFKTEDDKYGKALISDIDDDGKDDIIIGGYNEKNVRLLGFSGLLKPLFDVRYSELYNAATMPCFIHDGLIYFTAVSQLDIPPKISGALNPFTEAVVREYFTGPVPIKIVANKDFSLFTISNYPKNAAALALPERTVSDHDKSRASLYLLDEEGTKLLQKSLGDEFSTNKQNENVISSVSQQIADLNKDGTDEIIAGISHLSAFFPGKAAVELYSQEGHLIKRHEFCSETEVDFKLTEGENTEIAVLLKQDGGFYLLDEQLEIIHETVIPDFSGEALFQECGDFDNDGDTNFLITDYNIIYIYNSKLEIIYSTAEPALITQAGFIKQNNGTVVMYTLADKLRLYKSDSDKNNPNGSLSVFTNPPGAEIFMDGKKLDNPVSGVLKNITPGKYTFEAKLGEYSSGEVMTKIRAGRHSVIELKLKDYPTFAGAVRNSQWQIQTQKPPEVLLSSFDDLHLVSKSEKSSDESVCSYLNDYAGDMRKDLLFINLKTGELVTRDIEMMMTSRFIVPGLYVYDVYDDTLDLNNDGKHDIFLNNRSDKNFYIYSADGKLLDTHRFLLTKASNFSGSVHIFDQTLKIAVNCGYSLQPRGLLAYDIGNRKMKYFTPTAGIPGDICTVGGYSIPNYYTTCNGGVLKLPDGSTADDLNYYIHIIDDDGKMLPQSFNPEIEYNDGHLYFYSMDADDDGEDEIYMVTIKDKYYNGPCEIFRVDPSEGKLTGPLFSAGQDESLYLLSKTVLFGKPVITAFLNRSGLLIILSENFEPVAEYRIKDFNANGNAFFPDLDGDGNMEIILSNNDNVVLNNYSMERIKTFEIQETDGKLQRCFLDDTDLDNKPELVIVTDNSVSVYAY